MFCCSAEAHAFSTTMLASSSLKPTSNVCNPSRFQVQGFSRRKFQDGVNESRLKLQLQQCDVDVIGDRTPAHSPALAVAPGTECSSGPGLGTCWGDRGRQVLVERRAPPSSSCD